MKTKLLLDIDGVLADFYVAFIRYLNQTHGTNIDESNEPTEYNIDEWCIGIDPADIGKIIQKWLANGGYKTLPIYTGAKQFVYKLMDKYDVYIVTARIGDFHMNLPQQVRDGIKRDTYEWFQKHGIPSDGIFFEHKKVDFCKAYDISIIIEDKLDTVISAANEGMKAILIDRAYNRVPRQRNHPNITVTYNYDEVLNQLEQLG